ncbi:hypothetical protein EHQ43_08595 [Leptospira bouyouniensis]|uniref:Uncharacterized protein n=1 Tax=Leptospira bouyouniensis TaxID=2484911 RepID=A0A7I0HS90_9LEPT|nr:hypothetical protein [Leptospira bouyouniensis]TGL06462.1 hypothetical protein EHQ43_08595 [Leptospira bouyouniensis]
MDKALVNQLDFVISNATSAFIEALGMHWTNVERQQNGHSAAYDESSFNKLIEQYELGYNSIVNRSLAK